MLRATRPIIFLVFAVGLPTMANAQATSSPVDLHQYQPTPFSDRELRLDRTGVLPFGQFRIGSDFDYARRPLVLVDTTPAIIQAGDQGPNHNLIEHAGSAFLAASFGVGHRLEIAAGLPVTLYQSGQSVPGVATPSIVGVGNLRLGVKAQLLSRKGFGFGSALLVSAPIGVGSFTYEKGFTGDARVFADYSRGRLGLGIQTNVRLRSPTHFYDLAVGNELGLVAGASFQLFRKTSLLFELAGNTALANPYANFQQSPTEVLAGVRQRFGKTWLTIAGGPGLTDGYGSPIFRAVAAFTWANRPPDADNDGIPDDNDLCPEIPEDRDGFEDTDGCPDPDNDKDGILDVSDKCPDQAEDKDGFEDSDGCPDPDNDKDGILDANDKCPDKAETVNDFEDTDGCPDEVPPSVDTDKDGIVDEDDECPEEPEDKDGFEDEDGCPDPDNDKDGILDANDKCPLEPETINGVDDDDGCPDQGKPEVRLGPHEIETLKPIFFATDRSRVRHAFQKTLRQIALLMKAHPEIGRVGVEGHTDATGPADWNQRLSVRRAESVVEFLAREGVDKGRLVPLGQAEKLPWASNDTPWGRAKNRRVMFHVEGVDAATEQKQAERKERRRHIHHRHHKVDESQDEKPQTPENKPIRQPREKATVTPGESAGTTKPSNGHGMDESSAPDVKKITPKKSSSNEEGADESVRGSDHPPKDSKPSSKAREEGEPHEVNSTNRKGTSLKDAIATMKGREDKSLGTSRPVREKEAFPEFAPRDEKTPKTALIADPNERKQSSTGLLQHAEDEAAQKALVYEGPAEPDDLSSIRKPARRKRWPGPTPRAPAKPLFTGPAPTLPELLQLPPRQ